mgnify:CR=1 FL=1
MKQHKSFTRLMSKPLALSLVYTAIALGSATPAAAQEKVLRIGMTAADIPRTLGQPDQGFEGNRFTGRGRSTRPGDSWHEGESGCSGRQGLASPAPRQHDHHPDAKRDPLVVLSAPRWWL